MLSTVDGSRTILRSVVCLGIARKRLGPQACFEGCPEDRGSQGETLPETGREVGRLHYRFTPQMML